MDLTSTDAVREWCYTETLATGTGTWSSIDMLYVGMEDGRFLGYFSPTSYTFKGAGSGAADDPELGWSPYTLDTVNQHCGDIDIECVEGKTVSASCGAGTYDGECHERVTGSRNASTDNQAACESAGNIWWAPCTASGCCDSSIRNYYSTLPAARGAAVNFTRWRVYDHRVRPWYREAIAAWLYDQAQSSWSSVYVFSTSGQLGVTAMQTMAQTDGTVDAVFAIDFALGDISGLLNSSLNGIGASFAYIVEVGPMVSGLLVGLSTEEALRTSAGERRSALEASHSHIAESAAILASLDWPGEKHLRHGAGSVGWEIDTTLVTRLTRGLPWLVVAGQSISCQTTEIWDSLDGRCVRCPAGKQPEPVADRRSRWEMSGPTRSSWEEWLQEEDGRHECVQCPTGKATLPGQEGVCVQCEDGKQPTPETAANCDRCDLQSAGVGGHCHVCDKDRRGEVPSDDSTECVCPVGTYDSWRPLLSTRAFVPPDLSRTNISDPYHIFCWNDNKNFVGVGDPGFTRAKKGYPGSLSDVDSLPDPGAGSSSPNFKQLEDFAMRGTRRCVACPDCVQCAGKNGQNVSIQEGWALLGDSSRQDGVMYEDYGDNDLDVFKCESGACLAFRLSNDSAAANCKDALRQGPLCTRCKDMYTKTNDGQCKPCHGFDDPKTVWSLVAVASSIVLLPFAWKFLRESIRDEVTLFFGTAERSWPRLRQSLNILIANYQISRRIAGNSGIEWGPGFQAFYDKVGAIAELDFLQLPGVSCLSGNSFYARWITKMCIMPAWAMALYGLYRYQVSKVGKGIDDPRDLRQEQGKLNHDSGVLQKIERNLDSLSVKVKTTVEIGLLRSRYAGIMFMVVYLLYPGVAAACFQMFHCRYLEGGSDVNQLALLEVDMRLECSSLGGERSETYQMFSVLGIIAVCVYPIGVPLFLGIVLFTNRKTIQKNPNYITLGGLKPMFIFYKSDCYLWEVYFMIQKVILVGFMGVLSRGALTNVINVSVSVFMLTVLFKYRPSKTEEYNNANILSQTVILVTYMLAQYTRSIEADLDEDARQLLVTRQTLILGSIQGLMAVYLIYISTVKLRAFWNQQREDIIKERKIKKQAHQNASATAKAEAKEKEKKEKETLERTQNELRIEEDKVKLHCIEKLEVLVKPYGELRLPQGGAKDLQEELQRKIERVVLPPHAMICNASRKVTADREVDPGIFWLLSGEVLVFDKSPHSGVDPLHTISPGSVFGERTAIVTEETPSTWLKAASRVEAFVLWGTELAKVIERRHVPLADVEYRKWQKWAEDESEFAELTRSMENARSNALAQEQHVIALENKMKNSEREGEEALLMSFKIFDLDGDGGLAKEEIFKVMGQMGRDLNDAETALLNMLADTDGSGSIDFYEFKVVWGSGDLNARPTKAWVGGIPIAAMQGLTPKEQQQKIISAFMHRESDSDSTDWAFVTNTGRVGRLVDGRSVKDVGRGEATLKLIEGKETEIDVSKLTPCKSPVGIVLDAIVWQERHKFCWAKVTFKGVHALALAMALNDVSNEDEHNDEAVVIRDPGTQTPCKLRVDTWSFGKEAALAARLAEDLEDWDVRECTVMVNGLNVQVLESDSLVRQGKGRTGKFDAHAEADTPITSGNFFKAQHPETGEGFGDIPKYEFKKDGPHGAGYYKLGALERFGGKAGIVGTVAAKSVGVAASTLHTAGAKAVSAGAAVSDLARTASTRDTSASGSPTSQANSEGDAGANELSPSSESNEVFDDPEYLRHLFSPFGTYMAGTVRYRGGSDSYALVSLGKAAVARVLAQPRPAQLQAYRFSVVDAGKLEASEGMFKMVYKRHMKKAQKELESLTTGQHMMWIEPLARQPVLEPEPEPGRPGSPPRSAIPPGRQPGSPPRSSTPPPQAGLDDERSLERVHLVV